MAQRYIDEVVRGDYELAAQWVTPGQRGILQALALGQGAGVQLEGDLTVADVATKGQYARATLVGQMCRTAQPTASEPDPRRECIANQDPASANPRFWVDLFQTSEHGWRVAFPGPNQ